MTLGWHMILGFDPSLVGCYIWDENYSYNIIKKSKECVINIPTVDLAEQVVQIGNSSGREIDKFKAFNLTPLPAQKVKAPLIKECYDNYECKLIDTHLINSYNLFVFKVIKAHAAISPQFPKTIHYRGDGLFMIAGRTVKKYRDLFKPEML